MSLPLCRNPYLGPHHIEHEAYVGKYDGFCFECANHGIDELVDRIAELEYERGELVKMLEQALASHARATGAVDGLAVEGARRAVAALLERIRVSKPGAVLVGVHTASEEQHDRPPGSQR